MMTDGRAADRYARAFFELASKRNLLETMASDLKTLVTLLQTQPRFAQLLAGSLISPEEKGSLIERTLQSSLSPFTIQCLNLLVRKGRFAILDRISERFRELYNEARAVEEVTVFSRFPLDREEETRLKTYLGKKLGKKIVLKEKVDPETLGGLLVATKNQVLDGTVRTRLRELRGLLIPMG